MKYLKTISLVFASICVFTLVHSQDQSPHYTIIL